jgi:two-component system cell cycle sensor histidine kinase/response regulator CckA
MVVDDNAANRDLVATLLGYRGHTVVSAADGLEALESARRERPDLVISDLVMPVMDGYELMREIRADKALATLPAIFYTANYLEAEVRPMAAALGVGHIVAKPIDPANLLRTVDEALASGASVVTIPTEAFQREHQRAVSAKLADKVGELESVEAALLASEARFRSLAEHAPIGIFSLDAAGQVSYANPRLIQICGNSPDVTTIRWHALAHPDDRDQLIAGLTETIVHNTRHEQRLRLIVGDDEVRWVHIHLVPVVDALDDVTFVGTLEDVTAAVDAQRQREEIERRLQLSERLESLGELAAGIAHDFNNVLSVIMSYNEFVEEDLRAIEIDAELGARLVENTEAVRRAAERAAALTNRLLVFARRGEVHPELIDANDAIREALALLTRTIGAHVKLVDDLDATPHLVIADRTQLEQVVVNLVVNARDAVGLRGRVVVSSERVEIDAATAARHVGMTAGSFTRLTVSDNGCGIPPDVLSRIFEPFFTTKPSDQGTGLGLSTVYGIATSLGGNVSVTSTLGQGTSVDVHLPLAVRPSIGTSEVAPGVALITSDPPQRPGR